MEPTNEKALVIKIMEAIHKKYPTAWMLKIVGSPWQASGVPDILVVVDGLLIGLEAKHQKPGESRTHARQRATALQRLQIRLINNAGGMSGVVISVEESMLLIARALHRQRDKARQREEEETDVP